MESAHYIDIFNGPMHIALAIVRARVQWDIYVNGRLLTVEYSSRRAAADMIVTARRNGATVKRYHNMGVN